MISRKIKKKKGKNKKASFIVISFQNESNHEESLKLILFKQKNKSFHYEWEVIEKIS